MFQASKLPKKTSNFLYALYYVGTLHVLGQFTPRHPKQAELGSLLAAIVVELAGLSYLSVWRSAAKS